MEETTPTDDDMAEDADGPECMAAVRANEVRVYVV